jgi:hypothetical protein
VPFPPKRSRGGRSDRTCRPGGRRLVAGASERRSGRAGRTHGDSRRARRSGCAGRTAGETESSRMMALCQHRRREILRLGSELRRCARVGRHDFARDGERPVSDPERTGARLPPPQRSTRTMSSSPR